MATLFALAIIFSLGYGLYRFLVEINFNFSVFGVPQSSIGLSVLLIIFLLLLPSSRRK